MFEKRLALSVPYDIPLAGHLALAREMEALGYRDAWSLEVDGLDCFSPLTALAQGTNLRLGTAIANVFTRGPATLAQSAAAVAEMAPGRFVLGIGAGSAPIVEGWNSGHFERPATRVREMVTFLRAAFAGERVVMQGRTLTVNGYRMTRPPSQPIPLYVAALREGMLRLAGEVADGVILNWLSAEDVRTSVAVVREAAERAGRDPSSIEITARLMVGIDPPGPEGDTNLRRYIASYLNVPTYRDFHRWLGRTSLQGMWDAWDAGDRRGALAALSDEAVHEVMIAGSAAERRAHVNRFFEAGVDTAFLAFTSAEKDPARLNQLVWTALREHAPKGT